MAAIHIRKGDQVLVITGKDKGFKGRVIAVFPEAERVLVEGVNRIKKHTKVSTTSRGATEGGIVTQEAPIHISNVMLLDDDDKPTRVGYRREKVEKRRPDGTTYEGWRNVRISRRTGKDI